MKLLRMETTTDKEAIQRLWLGPAVASAEVLPLERIAKKLIRVLLM
jgi:hypothetical protein